MKHLFFILIISALFSVYAKAQEPQIKDPKALAVLDRVSQKAEQAKNLHIKFDYTIINSQTQETSKHKGHAFLQDDSYKLILPGIEVISDGESVWTYQKEVMEVSIDYADPESENLFNPSNIYTMYKEGFKYTLIGEYQRDNIDLIIIDLYPEKPREKDYTRLRTEVNKKTDHIVSFTTFGKDGIDYVIEFSEIKADISIPEGFFVFQTERYPADIEIIDLR